VPPVRKILLALVLFALGYATMQATRCDARAQDRSLAPPPVPADGPPRQS
jgi:hypothetical protein